MPGKLGLEARSPSSQIPGFHRWNTTNSPTISGNYTALAYASVDASSGNNIWTQNLGGPNTNTFSFGSDYCSVNIDNNASPGIWVPATKPTVLVGVRENNIGLSFLNGEYRNWWATGTRDQQFTPLVGRDTSSNNLTGARTYLILIWRRRLSDVEIREISKNPWQIFRPLVRRSFFDMGAGSAISLAVAKIFQSHALDGLVLTAQSDLAVTDANHGNAIGAIGLSASSLLAVVDASHDHLAENVALNTAGSENLIVLDSLHSHVANGVALTTQWLISVADALNSQSLESLTLSLDSHLAVADAGHGHASESMTLGVAGADNLVVSDVLHGQTSEGLALITEWLLIISDAAHAQLADSVNLTTDTLLAVQEVIHGQLGENVALNTSDSTLLAVQDAAHGHSANSFSLTLDTWLVIVSAAHAHATDTPTLSTEIVLQIAEALHARYTDTVVLSFPGVTTLTPDDISAIAAAVLVALNGTTIPVDAVTGAWPTAIENADALLSRTWP